MAELGYKPVLHDQKAFLEKAMKRKGFSEAYEELEEEYAIRQRLISSKVGRNDPCLCAVIGFVSLQKQG